MPSYEKPTTKSSRVAKKVSSNAKGAKPFEKAGDVSGAEAGKLNLGQEKVHELAKTEMAKYFDEKETTGYKTEHLDAGRVAPTQVAGTEAPLVGPESEPVAPPTPDAETERKNREEFEKLKKDFDENEKKIAATRHKTKGKMRIIVEALGWKKEDIQDEKIKEYLKRRDDLYSKLKESGRLALSGDEKEWAQFEYDYHESVLAIKSRKEEDKIRSGDAKYGNILIGLANLSKNYRDFISKQFLTDGKMTLKGFAKGAATAAAIGFAATSLIAASLPALGVVAVGSAGAVSAAAFRGFTSLGAGYAAKKAMEKGFVERTMQEAQADVLKIIEARKQKTDAEWKVFIAKREDPHAILRRKSVTEQEQEFARKDANHKRGALAIGLGTFGFGTIMSHYVIPHTKGSESFQHLKGYVGNAWDKVTQLFGESRPGYYNPAHNLAPDAEMIPKAGAAAVPEKIEKPFLGDSHRIKSGENVWKVTRDMYIEHAKDYKLDPNDPKIKNLFHSLKNQGFLSRMGINVDNFNDLSDAEKIKILAENKTANAMEWYKSHHGGKLPSVVREGYVVTLDDKEKLFVGDASQIKAGAVHHEPAHGAGRAEAEHHVRGGGKAAEAYGGRGSGGKAVGISQFDQEIEGHRARGAAADSWFQSEERAQKGAEIQALNEQGISGMTKANLEILNKGLKEGIGNGFKPSTSAQEVLEGIKNLSPGVNSDLTASLTGSEITQRGNAVRLAQRMFIEFKPLNARETMDQYMERMSRANFYLFKAISALTERK